MTIMQKSKHKNRLGHYFLAFIYSLKIIKQHKKEDELDKKLMLLLFLIPQTCPMLLYLM